MEVDALHIGVIEVGGGSHGLRDAALLESALARPQNLHAYGETDIFLLAASYAEGVSRNHPFVDGNKRTAFMIAVNFLELNGHTLRAAKDIEYVEMMERLGQGKLARDAVGALFASQSEKNG